MERADLPPKQARFVEEYLVDLNATRAAIRAGYSARTAEQQGPRLLGNVGVRAAIAKAQAKRAERTEITADRVLQELWAIATADANELIQFRRGACRDCWAVQPIDGIEEELEPQPHGGALKRAHKADEDFSERDRDPNPDCLTCSGEGAGRAFVADTRKLKGAARKLYAGVKITKDGVEVKMHDKAAALVNVGRHLGMFTDKVDANISGGLTVNIKRFTPEPSGD